MKLPSNCKLASDKSNLLPNSDRYRRIIGRLLYLGFPRPDLTHATQQLSQFMSSHTCTHWNAALHVLKYLKGLANLGFFILQPLIYLCRPTVMLIGHMHRY